MGNKARLRTLHLADGKTKEAGQLWPSYKDSNFTEHNHTPVAEMIKDKNGGVWFIASPDEKDPTKLYMLKIHIHIGNILVKKQRNIGIVPIQVMS